MTMKRIIMFVALVALMVCGATAQNPQPVKWTFSNVPSGKNGGTIVATATIEKGWHMYGLDLPKGGPQPTTFTVSTPDGIVFADETITMPKATITHDTSWDMDLSWWDNKVTLKKKYTRKGKGGEVELKVRYMVCSGDRCLPPTTVTHKFVIK